MFDAAMDMVNAAAFAFGDELSLIKRKINGIASSPIKLDNGNTNDPVVFPRPMMAPEIVAMQGAAGFVGSQIMSPAPSITYWYKMLTDSELRHHMAAKDEVIKNQLRKSLERLESGDRTQFSAADYMIQREYSVAKKEKRDPDFYSRRTIDEVSC